MDELYNRIENLCKEAGENITTMCKLAGVPRSALSDYKAGRIKSLSADKLSKIASHFNVSVDYLLGNVSEPYFHLDNQRITDEINCLDEYEKKPAAQTGDELGFDDFTYALHNETKKLTEENRQKLLEMAKFFQQQQELAAQREKDKNN